MHSRRRGLLAIAVALLVAGCATPFDAPSPRSEAIAPGGIRPVRNRDRTRARTGCGPSSRAAPPAEPEISDGKNAAADEKRLRTQSYMRIGTSHFPPADANAREKGARQGQRVGAERVIVYPPRPKAN